MVKHMSAETIAKALGGRKNGRGWIARCPAHNDRNPSLSIDENDGRVLVKCRAGCEQAAVISALKARNAWVGSRRATPVIEPFTRDQETRERVAAAREIWAMCQDGGRLAAYLNARGITLPAPPSLRFHSELLHTPTGSCLPAMVAAVQDSSREIVAIHRTYLSGDCDGKAAVTTPKMGLGRFEDGAVRLAYPARALGLAEASKLPFQPCTYTACPYGLPAARECIVWACQMRSARFISLATTVSPDMRLRRRPPTDLPAKAGAS
jgi:putative DNA primase/helicase